MYSNKEEAINAVQSLNESIIDESNVPIILSLGSMDKETIEKLNKVKKESYKNKYEGCNLVIKNIPKEITERNLFEICKKFGDIAVARLAI